MVVHATAKILIFQQITTNNGDAWEPYGCTCYCKDTNFSANHNHFSTEPTALAVVHATAKILIFQQITTRHRKGGQQTLLYMLLQRY